MQLCLRNPNFGLETVPLGHGRGSVRAHERRQGSLPDANALGEILFARHVCLRRLVLGLRRVGLDGVLVHVREVVFLEPVRSLPGS